MGYGVLALNTPRPDPINSSQAPGNTFFFFCHFDILLPDEPVDQGHRQKTLSVLVSQAVTCECGWPSGTVKPPWLFLSDLGEEGVL
jgi:hypothetical protein